MQIDLQFIIDALAGLLIYLSTTEQENIAYALIGDNGGGITSEQVKGAQA